MQGLRDLEKDREQVEKKLSLLQREKAILDQLVEVRKEKTELARQRLRDAYSKLARTCLEEAAAV